MATSIFPKESNQGIPIVEIAPFTALPGDKAVSIVTPDMCDKTTWYQNSIYVQDETLSALDTTYTSYGYASTLPIVDADSPRLIGEEYSFIKRDGTFAPRSTWRAQVKVNGIVMSGGYTIDYRAGTVAFNSPLASTDSVTISYYGVRPTDAANGVYGSDFIIRPDGVSFNTANIKRAEIQFSKDILITDSIIVEIWAALDNTYGYMSNMSLGSFEAGLGQYRMVYRGWRDFEAIANGSQYIVPAYGDKTVDTVVMVFDYSTAVILHSANSMLFRIYLANDAELGVAWVRGPCIHCLLIFKSFQVFNSSINLSKFLRMVRPGDIILSDTDTIYGNVIKWFIDDEWTHTSLVVGDGILLEAAFPKIYLDTDPYITYSLPNVLCKAMVLRLKDEYKVDTRILEAEAAKYAKEWDGTTYDVIKVTSMAIRLLFGSWTTYLPIKDMQSQHALMCTELVDNFYRDYIGIDLFKGVIRPASIVPGSFISSKILEPVTIFYNK